MFISDFEPKEVIEHDRKMILWDSESFRGGIWDDVKKGHFRSLLYIWEAWVITRINDYKTNKIFDAYISDKKYWVCVNYYVTSRPVLGLYMVKKEHKEWLEEQQIKYDDHWMKSDYNYYYFQNPDDAMHFKLVWA